MGLHVCLLGLGLALFQSFYAQGLSQDFLNAHNAARAEVGVGPMTWSDEVAEFAQNFTYRSIPICQLKHTGGPYGENLARSTTDLSISDAVKLWVDEKANYDYNSNTCKSGRVCGHYTQVVWANSIHLGCAKSVCNNDQGVLISCNYNPPGNYIGQRPYSISQQTPKANPPKSDSLAPSPYFDYQNSPEDYLNAHNEARAEVGVWPMIWDATVAAYAQNYANQRTSDCKVVRSGGPYGENLAQRSTDISGVDAVLMWVSEKAYYNINSTTCAAGKVCEHYIQVISRNSTNLGCARVRCIHGGTFVSCNYFGDKDKANQSTTPDAYAPTNDIWPHLHPSKGSINIRLVASLTSGAGALILGVGLVWLLSLKRKKGINKKSVDLAFDMYFGDRFKSEMGPRKFSHTEMAKATSNFLESKKLGEGGFGAVYKGFLRDSNSYVAVKRISRKSKQGIKEYTSEVNIISRLRHKNLVKLIGWCHEKELILAYEFLPNGSLDSHLFKGRSLLTWEARYKIVQGLASALLYLHEEGDHCVLHRDIKASNIMLDSSFNAKLGDFGLARLVDHLKGSQTTVLAGTMGYMAPECVTSSRASKESDVFSFGVVVLEIACGRRSIEPRYDEAQASLVAWVWESYGNGRLFIVADEKLCEDFDTKQMEYVLIVGLWCVHPDHKLRPSIRQVIHVLNFESSLPNLPSKMPVAKYDVPTASAVHSSEPSLSNMTVTVPR